jgi:hypothetical protein
VNSDVLEWSVVPSSLYSGSMLFNVTFNNNSVISCPSLQEEFEETKGVIRIRISKTNRQHNDQKKKYKRTNNDLEKHTHKTKDRVTRTPLKTGGEPRWSGRVGSSCSTNGTHRVNLVTNSVIIRESGKYREVFTTSGTFRCHLWHIYSISVNHVMVTTVIFSKWHPVPLFFYLWITFTYMNYCIYFCGLLVIIAGNLLI